jgi:hypothetical protein
MIVKFKYKAIINVIFIPPVHVPPQKPNVKKKQKNSSKNRKDASIIDSVLVAHNAENY